MYSVLSIRYRYSGKIIIQSVLDEIIYFELHIFMPTWADPLRETPKVFLSRWVLWRKTDSAPRPNTPARKQSVPWYSGCFMETVFRWTNPVIRLFRFRSKPIEYDKNLSRLKPDPCTRSVLFFCILWLETASFPLIFRWTLTECCVSFVAVHMNFYPLLRFYRCLTHTKSMTSCLQGVIKRRVLHKICTTGPRL
jgi:hypothetical protein